MGIDNVGSKLSRRDVTDLAAASEQLVVVADQIRGSGVRWGETAVNLLIVANNTIVRIQNKGAAAFARYLERHSPPEPPLSAEVARLDAELDQAHKTPPDEDEA